jgi:serine protease inhibitor
MYDCLVQAGMAILPDFEKELKSIYSAEISTVDFSKPSAAKKINNWIMEKTKNKIKNILPEAAMPGVIMALVNALYFKGNTINLLVKFW